MAAPASPGGTVVWETHAPAVLQEVEALFLELTAKTARDGAARAKQAAEARAERDQARAQRDDALRQLAATAEALRRTESQAAGYSELAQAHDTLAADFAALKAPLGLAEEESRRARPMRDALVRELQVRPSRRCSARRAHAALRCFALRASRRPRRAAPPAPPQTQVQRVLKAVMARLDDDARCVAAQAAHHVCARTKRVDLWRNERPFGARHARARRAKRGS